MSVLVIALTLFGIPKAGPTHVRNAPFKGGQFVLVDSPELNKPLMLEFVTTTVHDGKATTSKPFKMAVHFTETLVVTGGKDWTITRTGDGNLLGGAPMTYTYTQPDDRTIKLTTDCGLVTYKFSYDGQYLVLDDEKTKLHEVFRRL